MTDEPTSTMSDDVLARAREALASRWENPLPYAEPVPTGVVRLGDWASEHLPDLIDEVEQLRHILAEKVSKDAIERLSQILGLAEALQLTEERQAIPVTDNGYCACDCHREVTGDE